jgi:hypothetical protein
MPKVRPQFFQAPHNFFGPFCVLRPKSRPLGNTDICRNWTDLRICSIIERGKRYCRGKAAITRIFTPSFWSQRRIYFKILILWPLCRCSEQTDNLRHAKKVLANIGSSGKIILHDLASHKDTFFNSFIALNIGFRDCLDILYICIF